jgi:hypothetical protein
LALIELERLGAGEGVSSSKARSISRVVEAFDVCR